MTGPAVFEEKGKAGVERPFNLMIAGVGGQGNVLAVRLLGSALLAEGYEVAVGEVYGLSQRGGSVSSHLRFWEGGALSPRVPEGRLDVLLGFEPLEALRVLSTYGNRSTGVLVNADPIPPIGALLGRFDYPDVAGLLEEMNGLAASVTPVDAGGVSRELGVPQVMNTVMVGALAGSGLLPISAAALDAQIDGLMSERIRAVNHEAFAAGVRAGREGGGAG